MGVLGRTLLDWIGFGTGPNTDPYLAKLNAACLEGDLAECFKSRAIATFDEFFDQVRYLFLTTFNILQFMNLILFINFFLKITI